MAQGRREIARIFYARTALRTATRAVIESMENRRLLAAATIGTPSFAGHGAYLPVTLSGSGAPTLTASSVALQNLTAPNTAETHPVSVSTTAGTGGTVATFKLDRPYSASATVPVEDGWYDAYVRDPALTPDEAETTFRFLNADFDHDGGVSINDYNKLAGNFGKTQVDDGSGGLRPVTFADGDADYDGGVSINDYNILSSRFGLQLPAPPTQAGGVAVGNTTVGKLDLIWAADPNETRNGFKIYRSDDGGNTFNLIHTEANANARSWQDAGPTEPEGDDPAHPLVLDQKYWYRVRSYTTANGANAAITKAWGIPTQPTPAPIAVVAVGIGPGRILLNWSMASGASVTGFKVYRSPDITFIPSEATLIASTASTKTQIVDSGLSPGHVYFYRVVAVGWKGSVSLPTVPVSGRAQNEGGGTSNGGTPFDPTTHDSDNDGKPDSEDDDRDNDGIKDEDDLDDDNNGIGDNSEPDDRSAPTNPIPAVPSGWGSFPLYRSYNGGTWNYWPDRVPGYVNFSADQNERGDEEGVHEKESFVGDGKQKFTFSNLPKHSVVEIYASFYGDVASADPSSPNATDGGTVKVTLDGSNVPQFDGESTPYFKKLINGKKDKIEVEFTGSGFDSDEVWEIHNLSLTIHLPQVLIGVNKSALAESGGAVNFTATQYPAVGSFPVLLDWSQDTADTSDATNQPGSVPLAAGSATTTFSSQLIDDQAVEWTESLAAVVKPSDDYWINQALPPVAKTDILDNDTKITLQQQNLTVNNNDTDSDGVIDMNDTNGVTGETDLVPATLVLPPDGPLAGSILVNGNNATVWRNPDRTGSLNSYVPRADMPTTVYVEALAGSNAINGFQIRVATRDRTPTSNPAQARVSPYQYTQTSQPTTGTARGISLTTNYDQTNPKWTMIVGQFVSVNAVFLGPATSTSVKWDDFGDKAISNWDQTKAVDQKTPILNSNLSQPTVNYYYWAGGQYHIKATVTSTDGYTFSADRTLSVIAPDFQVTGDARGTVQWWGSKDKIGLFAAGPDFGGQVINGQMKFADNRAVGETNVFQTITRDASIWLDGRKASGTTDLPNQQTMWRLDNRQPFQQTSTPVGANGFLHYEDSPGEATSNLTDGDGIERQRTKIDSHVFLKTVIMYRAPSGIWVPIKLWTSTTTFEVSRNGLQWVVNSSSTEWIDQGVAGQYPYWEGKYENNMVFSYV